MNWTLEAKFQTGDPQVLLTIQALIESVLPYMADNVEVRLTSHDTPSDELMDFVTNGTWTAGSDVTHE